MAGTGRSTPRPWVAAVLGLATPGLGHLYAGRPLRGILVHVLALLLGALALRAFFLPFAPLNIVGPLVVVLCAFVAVLRDAVVCAKTAGPTWQRRSYNRWYVYLLIVLVAGFEQQAIRALDGLQAFTLPAASTSMMPTLVSGDHLFVDRNAYRSTGPLRGDIVVFRYPPDPRKIYLRRVMALPGETAELRALHLLVDGSPMADFYAHLSDGGQPSGSRDSTAPLTVPPDGYFVLADNRNQSDDSRVWGPVLRRDIIGRARVILFSWDNDRHRMRWERIGRILE